MQPVIIDLWENSQQSTVTVDLMSLSMGFFSTFVFVYMQTMFEIWKNSTGEISGLTWSPVKYGYRVVREPPDRNPMKNEVKQEAGNHTENRVESDSADDFHSICAV